MWQVKPQYVDLHILKWVDPEFSELRGPGGGGGGGGC